MQVISGRGSSSFQSQRPEEKLLLLPLKAATKLGSDFIGKAKKLPLLLKTATKS